MINKNKLLETINKYRLLEYLNNIYIGEICSDDNAVYKYIKNIFINKKKQVTIQLYDSHCVPFAHSKLNPKLLKFFKYYENTNQLVFIKENQTYNDVINLFKIYDIN